MVSKASEDLPEPLNPVMTVNVLRGISTSIFFRLCWRAPWTVMRLSILQGKFHSSVEWQIVLMRKSGHCVHTSVNAARRGACATGPATIGVDPGKKDPHGAAR